MSNTAALLQVLRNTLTEELKLYYYASNDLCKDAVLEGFCKRLLEPEVSIIPSAPCIVTG